MTIQAQINKIFYELFSISGFDKNSIDDMTVEVTRIWQTKSTIKILELFTNEEKNSLTNLDDLNKVVSSLDEDRSAKAVEIIYDEAGNLIERMVGKFNLRSNLEQQNELARRISSIVTSGN